MPEKRTVNLVDGRPADSLPLDDRGLHYGDGLFETLALRDGVPRHWARHYARLEMGCARLGFECPAAQLLLSDLESALPVPVPARLVAKIMVTRGGGGRGYAPPSPSHPRRILRLSPWPVWPASHHAEGIEIVCCTTALGRNPLLAGLKHLNRLEQVLAAQELAAWEAVEGLMFDELDQLIEGTRSNVFLVKDGELLTPLLDACGIAGVMRGVILELAEALDIPAREARLPRAALADADELFVCNSLIGLWPVRSIAGADGRRFGEPSLTRVLQRALLERDLLP